MVKRYRLGFEPWALVLFLLIMLPNFYWFAIPAPRDILRADSLTEGLDTLASVCQVLFVTALCLIVPKDRERPRLTPLILSASVSYTVYLAAWFCYYQGMTGTPVIFTLCAAPCLVFLLFALDRKNGIALIPISIFSVCHLIYGFVNFIV